ncbi:MAG: dihydroorotate dehydrogenase-like protein [Acidimicrobiales bacterium]
MATTLTTEYAGLELHHPLVASSSPLTGSVDTLLRLEAAGAAAVVLPSVFEEQIEHETMAIHHGLELGAEQFGEAAGGYLPEVDELHPAPEHHLELLKKAKAELNIPVIASLNGDSAGGWTYYANELQDEGADALELNVYHVAADVFATGEEVEDTYLRLVEHVRAAISIPLTVKIGPFFSSTGHMARSLADAGADGLILFNRFYQPDIDLDELTVSPNLILSTSAEMRLVLRWMAILRGRVHASLAASTGVHTGADATKLILAGADVVMMTSALLQHGPEHIATVLADLRAWFDERSYDSLQQARGSLSQESSPDPDAFERANYMKTLRSYSA